jgi:hypothetical protein
MAPSETEGIAVGTAMSPMRRNLVNFEKLICVNAFRRTRPMTAFPDAQDQPTPSEFPRIVGGQRWVVRSAQRLIGASLVLAAMGLWIQPGALLDADVMLMKLGVSLCMGFAGLAILQAGRTVPGIEVEIDTVRREVRLVRRKGSTSALVSRTAMTDLGPAEQRGNLLRLWAANGALLAEVAMGDGPARASMIGALRDSGKLAA